MRNYYMKLNYKFSVDAKNHVQAKEEMLEQLQDDLNNPLLDMKESIELIEFSEV